MKSPYKNISAKELVTLAKVAHEENNGELEKTARDIETIDTMLGVMKMKTLINSRERSAKSRFSRGRGLSQVLENIMLRELSASPG